MDYTVTLQFELGLHWVDRGLTFLNLKKSDGGFNRLSQADKDFIWKPKVGEVEIALRECSRSLTYLLSNQIYFHPTAPTVSTVDDERNYLDVTRTGPYTVSKK